MTYCHSSAFGCQWSSRRPPGLRSRMTPVTVFEIGNRSEPTRHSRPPLWIECGSWASIRYLWLRAGSRSGGVGVGGGALGGARPRGEEDSVLREAPQAGAGGGEGVAPRGLRGVRGPAGGGEVADTGEKP